MKILYLVLEIWALKAKANHPHHHSHHDHGGHHHDHAHTHHQMSDDLTENLSIPPIVSTFSHKLPGTGSFMSVTKYFNANVKEHNHSSNHHHDNEDDVPDEQQRTRVINAQGDQFHPWNPRFQVSRIEASDDEWKEQLEEELHDSGLLDEQGRILRQVPNGLVNLNYDIHVCVHMGTELTPEESAYPPTAISFPGDGESANKLHTLVMLDITDNNRLHWLVVNIPGPKVDKGKVIATYAGPNPSQGSGFHKYVMLVMEQQQNKSLITEENHLLDQYKSESSCDQKNRENFDLQKFRQTLNLSEPVAVNYFTQQFSDFVNNINGHCLKDVPIQPHPLYR